MRKQAKTCMVLYGDWKLKRIDDSKPFFVSLLGGSEWAEKGNARGINFHLWFSLLPGSFIFMTFSWARASSAYQMAHIFANVLLFLLWSTFFPHILASAWRCRIRTVPGTRLRANVDRTGLHVGRRRTTSIKTLPLEITRRAPRFPRMPRWRSKDTEVSCSIMDSTRIMYFVDCRADAGD